MLSVSDGIDFVINLRHFFSLFCKRFVEDSKNNNVFAETSEQTRRAKIALELLRHGEREREREKEQRFRERKETYGGRVKERRGEEWTLPRLN